MAQVFSARPDIDDALRAIALLDGNGPATRTLKNYIVTLEQQARNVARDADDAQDMGVPITGHAQVTWSSLNALRATINFPRRR